MAVWAMQVRLRHCLNGRLGPLAVWELAAIAWLAIVACTGTPTTDDVTQGKTVPSVESRGGTPFADQGLGLADGPDSSASAAVGSPSFEKCSGFLPVAVVRDFTKVQDLELETRKAPVVGAADATGLKAVCLLSYQKPDRSKAITLQASQFVSPAAASSRLQQTREFASRQATIEAAPVDANSFQAILNAGGIGSYIVFQIGSYQVQVTTIQTVGDPPLLTAGQLAALAMQALMRIEGG